eukprot:6181624-Pleurochrysis_carterae.AAC.2
MRSNFSVQERATCTCGRAVMHKVQHRHVQTVVRPVFRQVIGMQNVLILALGHLKRKMRPWTGASDAIASLSSEYSSCTCKQVDQTVKSATK